MGIVGLLLLATFTVQICFATFKLTKEVEGQVYLKQLHSCQFVVKAFDLWSNVSINLIFYKKKHEYQPENLLKKYFLMNSVHNCLNWSVLINSWRQLRDSISKYSN